MIDLKNIITAIMEHAPDISELPEEQQKCVNDITKLFQDFLSYVEEMNPQYSNEVLMCTFKRFVILLDLDKIR